MTASFARSPLGGKKSSVVAVRMTDEQKFDLERRAHELGMSSSEWVEKLAAVALYGLQHVLECERSRTERVCGLFTDTQAAVQAGQGSAS